MLQLVTKQHQCDQIKFCQLLKFSPHNLLDQLIHIFLSLNNETIGHKIIFKFNLVFVSNLLVIISVASLFL